MLSQNIQHTNIMDMHYWQDTLSSPTSSYLLTLWTLDCPSTCINGYIVTCIAGHPIRGDIIAVGYTASSGDEASVGAVACFSLKRPEQSLWCVQLESGVSCLSFKQSSSSNSNTSQLLAVGCHNGLIAVLPLLQESTTKRNKSITSDDTTTTAMMMMTNNNNNNNHDDGDCNVSSSKEATQQRSSSGTVHISWKDGGRNVLKSISSNGTVAMWKLEGSKLTARGSFLLKSDSQTIISSKKDQMKSDISNSLFRLRCLDITDREDDGNTAAWVSASDTLTLCSLTTRQTLWQSPPLHTTTSTISGGGYLPHVIIRRCPVVGSNLCLTLSLDWHIYMWNTTTNTNSSYIKRWDIGSEATDVQFAPGSRDIFAVTTATGVVKIFNLAVDPNQPVCSQKVVDRKRRLTRLMFSPYRPMIVVGDDHGGVSFLKLPPTLTTGTTSNDASSAE